MNTSVVVFLLLGVCGITTAHNRSVTRSIFRDLVEEWDCSGSVGNPVCGQSLFFTGRQTFQDVCALKEATCENPQNAKVPVTFGPCPLPLEPINCYFECPLAIQQTLCGVNRFGFQQEFGSLCELVHHNCEHPDELFHMIQCLLDD